MGVIWAITSGAGGLGASLITASLGVRLAKAGKHVILVDLQFGKRSLDMLLGFENRLVFDLGDVLDGLCELPQAIVQDLALQHLSLLSAPQFRDGEDVPSAQLCTLLTSLKAQADYVLVDAPSRPHAVFAGAAASADHVLLLASPDDLGIRFGDRVVGKLRTLGVTAPYLAVSRMRIAWRGQRLQLPPQTVAETMDVPLLGIVPEDELLAQRYAGHALREGGKDDGARALDTLCQAIQAPQAATVPLAVPLTAPPRRSLFARIRGAARGASME